jgi:flagellar hook-length control protein FliK
MPQPATQSLTTAATAATDLAMTAAVAATAPVEAKTTLLKPPIAAPAKTALSSAADAGSGAPDQSSRATAADAPQNNIAPPPAAAARQDGGNDRVETAKADAPASSPASPAAEPAHEHSLVSAAAHAPTGSSDPGAQATGAVPPQPAYAPAASLSVTAATAVPLSGLALEIAVSAKSGKSRFEIRLDPADLGRIDVRIDVDRNGRVTSHLTVEKPETLSMLRQDAPQLQRALDDAGLKTGNGGLQFSLRDQSSSGQDGNETGRNAQRLVIGDDETIPAAVAGRTYGRVLGSSGGVDIRV